MELRLKNKSAFSKKKSGLIYLCIRHSNRREFETT